MIRISYVWSYEPDTSSSSTWDPTDPLTVQHLTELLTDPAVESIWVREVANFLDTGTDAVYLKRSA